jgi:hypothetical protein
LNATSAGLQLHGCDELTLELMAVFSLGLQQSHNVVVNAGKFVNVISILFILLESILTLF